MRWLLILCACLIAASGMAQGLPTAANMEIKNDGVYLNGNMTANIAGLTTALKILAARRPAPMLYVSSQPGVNPAAVSSALNLAQSVGLTCLMGRAPQIRLPYDHGPNLGH